MIEEFAFLGLKRLQILDLSYNQLISIHERAFLPLANSLVQLDLAFNKQLSSLPESGLAHIHTLKCFGNPNLRELPHFPRARFLALTFAYHCCDYQSNNEQQFEEVKQPQKADYFDQNHNSKLNLEQQHLMEANNYPWPFGWSSVEPARDERAVKQPQKSHTLPFIPLNDLVLWSSSSTTTQSSTGHENQFDLTPGNKTVLSSKRDRRSSRSAATWTHPWAPHGCRLLEEGLFEQIESIRRDRSIDGAIESYYWPFNEADNQKHDVNVQISTTTTISDKIFKRQIEADGAEISGSAQQNSYQHHPSKVVGKLSNAYLQVKCLPKPSAFFPCRDLFDTWWLRLGIWCVFPLALVGNFLVIIVLSSVKASSSSSALTSIMWLAHSKRHIDVPRFLVINLAIADLLMALYLGLLALVDLSTLGHFKLHAIKWQFSAGCQIAGFFAVLSSELSVFILAIITLERNYAITNAVYLNRRLSLQHAMLIMFLGYAFAIGMALLPLQGINDYRKFSICLPLDLSPQNKGSQMYIFTLISMNTLSFMLLFGCYLRMYCAIRGSQAWNTNDLRIAKRMSILVLTDFLCWSPIIASALAALLGKRVIDTTTLKVMTIFILPLNSIANPFLYAITTRKFKRDLDSLLHRLRHILSLGRYPRAGPLDVAARRTANPLHQATIEQRHRLNQQQRKQQIIITCRQQHKQQRLRRLRLELEAAGQEQDEPEQDDDSDQLGQATAAAARSQALTLLQNQTFNQVTMNQTTCCIGHLDACEAANRQQVLIMSANETANDNNGPRIILDCEPSNTSSSSQSSGPAMNNKPGVNDNNLSSSLQVGSQNGSPSVASNDKTVKSISTDSLNRPPSIACRNPLSWRRALPMSTYCCPARRIGTRCEPPNSSELCVASQQIIKSGGDQATTSAPASRPRSALASIPDRQPSVVAPWPRPAAITLTTERPLSRACSQQTTDYNQQNQHHHIAFGSDDLISTRSEQPASRRHQMPTNETRRTHGSYLKPFAKAWSSLQSSLAVPRSSSQSRPSSSLVNQGGSTRLVVGGSCNQTFMSTSNNRLQEQQSPQSSSSSLEINEVNLAELLGCASSSAHPKDRSSAYLLLVNQHPKWAQRRMSKSCETVRNYHSHHLNQLSPQHDISNKATQQQSGEQPSMTTTSSLGASHLDEDDQRVLLATINRLAHHRSRPRPPTGWPAPRSHKMSTNHRSIATPSRELTLLGNPSKSTRCRSWSPALLGKLEDCIGHLKNKLSSKNKGSTSRARSNHAHHYQEGSCSIMANHWATQQHVSSNKINNNNNYNEHQQEDIISCNTGTQSTNSGPLIDLADLEELSDNESIHQGYNPVGSQ